MQRNQVLGVLLFIVIGLIAGCNPHTVARTDDKPQPLQSEFVGYVAGYRVDYFVSHMRGCFTFSNPYTGDIAISCQ